MKSIVNKITDGLNLRIKKFKGKIAPKNYFKGLYENFEIPEKLTKGFEDLEVFNKIKTSNHKVKAGEGLYESNGIVINANNWSNSSIFLALSLALIDSKDKKVLDFGGSMGTIYNQYKLVLDKIPMLEWNIVEQKHYVEYAKKHFETNQLKFYESLDECIIEQKPNIFFASGSIQYLPNPFEVIEKIIAQDFEYIIFGTLPIIRNKGGHKVTIQKVDTENYCSSFPSWIFNIKLFLALFKSKYQTVNITETPLSIGTINIGLKVVMATVIFRRIETR